MIITARVHTEGLRACLEALSSQAQSATDFEVIVIADSSTNGMSSMLARLTTPYKLRVLWKEHGGDETFLNRAVRVAEGCYCLFLDGDINPSPQLVAEHLRIQCEREGVIGLGALSLALPQVVDEFARWSAEWQRNQLTELEEGRRSPSFMDCHRGNLSVPRTAFADVGGFRTDLSHDAMVELAYRLVSRGLAIVYIPTAMGQQEYRKGFRELMANAEKTGMANVELYHRQPSMLPYLELGAFSEATLRAIFLRRILLTLRVPLGVLSMVGPLLGKRPWAREWYRFLYSYCYWRGVRRAVPSRDVWLRLTRSPVILMYHAFGMPGEAPSRYIVPGRRFALQMAWLKWRRYPILTLTDFLRCRQDHRLPPACSVILTFDDGYADNWTIACPILRRHNFVTTIFLVSRAVGDINQWDSDGELAGRPLLSWSDIREMLSGGMHFGAHTRNHVRLTDLPADQVEDEVGGSRTDLERELDLPIVAFAYPQGAFDQRSRMAVQRAGYLGACTVHAGANDPVTPLDSLRRVEIRGTDSFVRFTLAVWLGKTHIISRLRYGL